MLLAQVEGAGVEDVISESRAAELLGMSLEQFWQEEARQHEGFPVAVYHG